MFWKKTSSWLLRNPYFALYAPVRNWSITTRLTVLFGIYAFALLAASSGIVYWGMLLNSQSSEWKFLANKIFVLQTILTEHAVNPIALQQEVEWEKIPSRTPDYYAYYSRITEASKKLIIQTPGMEIALAKAVFPVADYGDIKKNSVLQWKSASGRSYLLAAAWGNPQTEQDSNKIIEVALDVTRDSTLIEQHKRQMSVVLLIGLVLAIFLGNKVARRGMRPLLEITRATEQITANHLYERIDPARWPKELAVLAGAFDRMLDRLEKSFTRLSQFSADLAHEVRTPINNLMGEVEVTLLKTRTPDEYRQTLESNLEEFQRLSHMIKSLLFIARAEEAREAVKGEWLNVHRELAGVCDFHSAVAEEKGVLHHCHGQARLWADPALFRLAVSNLLANALQYTPSGGHVEALVTQFAGGAVEISIKDTGCGIGQEDLERVFDRFYRSHRARSQYPVGAGLGLAIVKSIMEMHAGEASVHSTPGQGTVFSLKFPAHPEPVTETTS